MTMRTVCAGTSERDRHHERKNDQRRDQKGEVGSEAHVETLPLSYNKQCRVGDPKH
jgi:hypothetical protein